jgi:hypothetical protein
VFLTPGKRFIADLRGAPRIPRGLALPLYRSARSEEMPDP